MDVNVYLARLTRLCILVLITFSLGLSLDVPPRFVPDPTPFDADHSWYRLGEAMELANQEMYARALTLGEVSWAGTSMENFTGLARKLSEVVERRELEARDHTVVRITSRFGPRYHPILRRWRMHNGVDFGARHGTPIYAVDDGVVEFAGWRGGYGRFIVIKHDGYYSEYAHMSSIARGLTPGVEVYRGERIAAVGASGLATGNHLHFSIRVGSTYIDPMRDGFDRGEPLEDAELLITYERSLWRSVAQAQVSIVSPFVEQIDTSGLVDIEWDEMDSDFW